MMNPDQNRNQGSNKIAWMLLSLILLVAAGIYVYAGWQGYREAPKLVEVKSSSVNFEDPYALSNSQQEKIFSHGYPEAFTILYYEEELAEGSVQTVRLEIWDYYTGGMELTFINGELVAEDPIESSAISELSPLPYSPGQFTAFMSLSEVIATAGIAAYIEIPLDREIMDQGVLYYADSLSFGIQDNRLIYIEALALTEN
jgi:hypothetical protein